ncbi:pentapeptide repeat-containing protein [Pseudovibrio sp. SPO723]|uniref:pentapeptide repeat-containing protein n=1 Tax=Nesiotobacter zosterae TaxID=392721 RepID=UPI0029C32FF3|nr:pentapeptide repeat-containing protein [Pseudovibrio sp. SPO723]MDX5593448.1 pentapeptide repeat-containing protein [Pseudovibrio sp. SPO723]
MTEKKTKHNLLSWLGFQFTFEPDRNRFVGTLLGFVFVLLGALLILSAIVAIIGFLQAVLGFRENHEAIRNIGLVVAAIVGAPFVVWRAVVAQKQADTAEQSHITDQINKAVAGLGAERTVDRIGRSIKYVGRNGDIEIERTEIEWQGKPLSLRKTQEVVHEGEWKVFSETLPNLEVRIGAIYALERIAQDSLRDHIQIMEILTAYIRENAPAGKLEARSILETWPKPRTDIQAAIDVIGRRTDEQVKIEWEKKYRLDLRETNLSGVNFTGGKFEGALLDGSDLQDCRFDNAKLKAVRMSRCLLNFADFYKADLTGAILDGARIDPRGLDPAKPFSGSFTWAKEIRGLSLAGADISAVVFPKVSDNPITFGTSDTKLFRTSETKRSKRLKDMEAYDYTSSDDETQEAQGVRRRLEEAGFFYWSHTSSDDGYSWWIRNKFKDHLGLRGFPYED